MLLMTEPYPPFRAEPAAFIVPTTRNASYRSWQTVHARLAAQAQGYLAPTSLADLAVYYACVYHTWGDAVDGGWAQRLGQRLAVQPWPAPGHRWAAPQLAQAIALAWLAAHGAGWTTPRQLAALDESLHREAHYLLALPHCPRPLLGQLVRYLRLRLPAPCAAGYLHNVLAHWPTAPTATAAAPQLLGLDGLAAELLGLLHAHRAGARHPFIQARVQQGLRSILATKRDVDFSEHAYAIFPHQVHGPAQPPYFSAELSWRRGDAGMAWLLYEAQAMLLDAELAHIAELVGLHTLLRTDVAATEVVGPGFYQGAAGVAHLYAQLYRTSRLPAYCTAYDFWLGRTHKLVGPGPSNTLTMPPTHEPLDGLVGVGLVLLTAASERCPAWEDIIM